MLHYMLYMLLWVDGLKSIQYCWYQTVQRIAEYLCPHGGKLQNRFCIRTVCMCDSYLQLGRFENSLFQSKSWKTIRILQLYPSIDRRKTYRVSLQTHNAEIIASMESVFGKISWNSNCHQVSLISHIISGHSFKRKSNEEQFKFNSKVNIALEDNLNVD